MEKAALFLPAPESLSWEKNAVIHSVSKGCQEFVRRLIVLTPAPKRRIELAQRPGPGKRATRHVAGKNIGWKRNFTESATLLETRAVRSSPISPLPPFVCAVIQQTVHSYTRSPFPSSNQTDMRARCPYWIAAGALVILSTVVPSFGVPDLFLLGGKPRYTRNTSSGPGAALQRCSFRRSQQRLSVPS